MLSNLLSKLQDQVTENLFTYSAIVIDNDVSQSGRNIITDWEKKSKIRMDYYCEPEQNIALARNKAVENAKGNFIAFIDDDECPNDNWLINLFRTQNQYQVTGVLGPVKPYFETEPPKWIIKGRICERPSFVTGTIIKDLRIMRTGNVLLDRSIFKNGKNLFDQQYGKTGGEDIDFFHRMLKQGFRFIWCNEACVYENVPPERFEKSYYLKRALMRGVVNSKRITLFSTSTLKSLVASLFYTMFLPLFFLLGQHIFMKYLIKDCDHIGKLLGLCGIYLIRERPFI